MDPIYVTGHRNPDTDSIVSAMAYAALQNALGNREYVAARLGHFGHVHRLGGFVNTLQCSTPEIPEKLRPCVLPLPDAHRVRNFQAFVSHKAREHSAHHDGFARRAALARYLQCPRALRGEAVYRV